MSASDPTSIRITVFNVVVDWIATKVNTSPSKIDVSRTFVDNPPGGYGFSEGMYLEMCDEITPAIVRSSGRALKLPGNWRVQHEKDAISDFINAVAIRVIAAPLTSTGVKAHKWAMGS
jgi:hypothetical protein